MRRRLIAVAVAALAALVMLSGCGLQAYDLPLPGKQVSDSDGYRVTADFDDVVDVVPRTLVMVDDVPVGQVDSIKRVGWHARVTMTVKKNIVLPKDAIADVRQTSLLGEKYVALSAPTGSTVAADGRLGDGAFIPLSRTGRNPEVEEVLGALSFLLSGGGIAQLKTISTELNTMMDGRQGDITDLLHQLDTMVGSLNGQKSDIVKAMREVNRLTTTLNREKGTIAAAIDSFGPAIKVLHQQHRDLVTMLTSLDDLGTVATRVINESGDNLTASLKQLQPTLRKLADAGDSLPRGLMMMASFPFPKESATLAKGDYSNALFHMDLDLGKLFNGLGNGTETGLPQVLQLCQTYSSECTRIQPLLKSLCTLTHEDIACSAVNPGDAAGAAGQDLLDDFTKQLGGGKAAGKAGSGGSPGGTGGLKDLTGALSGLLGGGG